MCDQILQRISLRNVPAVGESNDENFTGITSLQYININYQWPSIFSPKVGFAPSSTKMSKDATVTVLGSRQQSPPLSLNNSSQPTNRHGLHIYLRKACETSGVGKTSRFGDWFHHQSIIETADKNKLQIDELEVSKTGVSIVALDALLPKIYVFEQQNQCLPTSKWALQQTIKFTATDGFLWNKIALNDDHLRMLVRKINSSDAYQFSIFTRERSQKKGKTALQSPNEYLFQPLQDLLLPSGFTATGDATLSHDGQTVIIVATDVSDVVHVLQYKFQCETNRYDLVANFFLHSLTSLVLDIKFGGPCSERLYILTRTIVGNNIHFDVEVHSRLSVASSGACLSKHTTRPSCCGNIPFKLFGDNSLIDFVENVLYDSPNIDSGFTHSLLTEFIDGDLFVVVSIQKFNNVCSAYYDLPFVTRLFARLWRQNSCQESVKWCSCNLSDSVEFQKNLCYDMHSYDVLSFDHACQQYYFPFTQRMVAISNPSYFVTNPDGCFYFCVYKTGISLQYYYYLRVHGDKDYILFDEDGAITIFGLQCGFIDFSGNQIVLNESNCAAKELDVILVQKATVGFKPPTPMDILMNPSIIFETATIPMRLCFSVVGFAKKLE